MKIAELNIVRKCGDTKRLSFIVKRKGRAVDISAWTNFKLGIDSESEPADNSTNITVLTGALTTDGSDGRVHFLVPSDIPAGNFYYDAQAVDENSEVGTFVEGTIKFKQDRAK